MKPALSKSLCGHGAGDQKRPLRVLACRVELSILNYKTAAAPSSTTNLPNGRNAMQLFSQPASRATRSAARGLVYNGQTRKAVSMPILIKDLPRLLKTSRIG
ncbi:MAG: hypothetical protein ACREB3_15835 [Burkholderiales bacterium]